MTTIACPNCGVNLDIEPDGYGQIQTCPACAGPFDAPGGEPRVRLHRTPANPVRAAEAERAERSRAGAIIAAILVPGAGQLVQGRWLAAAFFFGLAVGGALFALRGGITEAVVLLGLTWPLAVVDAAIYLRRA